MRVLALLLTLLWPLAAFAGCPPGTYPFVLTNGQLADASQVMANFNAIAGAVQSGCAAAGNNDDITALNALSTPITPAQGGTTQFPAQSVGGTANAVTVQVASTFSLTNGYTIVGVVGTQNTGPTTLTVNGGTAQPWLRRTQYGPQPMDGGELLAGDSFVAVYANGNWILQGEIQIVGQMIDYSGGAAPPGWLLADGSSFSCTAHPTLCSAIGTTYGGSASNPNLPDTRGRVITGLDNYASYGSTTGPANRLTSVSTGCGTSMTALGTACANASQSHTQIVAELAPHTHTITDPGHSHSVTAPLTVNGGTTTDWFAGVNTGTMGTVQTSVAFTGITGTNSTGSGQPMPIVNPDLGMLKIIKY